jgi:hypothetical protein
MDDADVLEEFACAGLLAEHEGDEGPHAPFSRQDVIDQVRRWQAGELKTQDSPIVQKWLEAAQLWFECELKEWDLLDDRHYALAGFQGLAQRTPEEVWDLLGDVLEEEE